MAARNTYKSNTNNKKDKSKGKFQLKSTFLSDRRFTLSFGFILMAISIFLLVALISYMIAGKADQSVVKSYETYGMQDSGLETENWLGLFGAITGHSFIYKWFGISAFLIPPLLFLMGYTLVSQKTIISLYRLFKFTLFFVFWISLLFGYITLDVENLSSMEILGGGIGFEMAILSHSLIGWGTYILLLLALMVFIIYSFNVTSLIGFGRQKKQSEIEPGKVPGTVSFENELDHEKEKIQSEIDLGDNLDQEVEKWEVKDKGENKSDPEEKDMTLDVEDTTNKTNSIEKDEEGATDTETNEDSKESDDVELVVDRAKGDDKVVEKAEHYDPTLDLGSYQYPTLDLLNDYPGRDAKVTREELEQNKEKIIETLVNFKIGISSIKATIGPTVTLYEIVPDAGVKISKIKNLEDDIALSLSALGIRIIAPIPGKGTIGIEVPNKNKQLVSVRSVFATEKFMKSEKELPIVLGRTISNEVYISDLTKMPHLLIAGATGQGKSVGLNIVLASLIYRKHPSQLKFILVDPKKVELTLYNKIERHFLAELPGSEESIVTDTKKVIYTLNSLTIEMDNRYNMLKDAQCRNLKEYNEKFVQRRLNPQKGHRYMPYIVLVVDELADLMMTAGKEIETPIARLAQLARAIGIHLVIATQRPDVKVITGTIKVNFPARISYKVVSKMDSRIILDTGGADQLVGMGDMLLSIGSDIIRLQCPFIETSEVDKICEFVGSQRGYPSAYLLPEYEGDESGEASDVDLDDRDALFDDAARLIVLHQQGSTSLIQRKMKLGYNRAGRLIDQLEAAGIVGPFEGSKAREVLINDEYALEQLLKDLDEKK